jgi:hypothetical protein
MQHKKTIVIAFFISLILLLLPINNVAAIGGEFYLITQRDNGNNYYGLCSNDQFIFVACGNEGLRIYNKTSHNLLTTVYDGGWYQDVDVFFKWIFVACAGGMVGLMSYSFIYTSDLSYSLTLNDSAYDLLADDYFSVYVDQSASYVFCGCGGEGILGYTYDFDSGALTLAGSQIDDDGSAHYGGISDDGAYVYVACGGDGVRAYTWDGATFSLDDVVDDSTDGYYDVVVGHDGYIYTANGVDGTFVYSYLPGFSYEYDRTDSSGTSYTWIWCNDTFIYYACGTEGLRAYSYYNPFTLDMGYLDVVRPGFTTCMAVAGDEHYVYYAAYHNGLYTYQFNLTSGLIDPPIIQTNAATSVTNDGATLNGFVTDDGGEDCTVWFEWGETIAYGHTTVNQTNGTGESFSIAITGLDHSTTYHFRAVGNNSNSTDPGSDMEFTTSIEHLDVNWTGIFDGISRMFTGGDYYDSKGVFHHVDGIFGGGQDTRALLGLFIFLILFFLTAMWGLGIIVGSVVLIPSVFLVTNYIPELTITVAIVTGLAFGLGLNRIIRR